MPKRRAKDAQASVHNKKTRRPSPVPTYANFHDFNIATHRDATSSPVFHGWPSPSSPVSPPSPSGMPRSSSPAFHGWSTPPTPARRPASPGGRGSSPRPGPSGYQPPRPPGRSQGDTRDGAESGPEGDLGVSPTSSVDGDSEEESLEAQMLRRRKKVTLRKLDDKAKFILQKTNFRRHPHLGVSEHLYRLDVNVLKSGGLLALNYLEHLEEAVIRVINDLKLICANEPGRLLQISGVSDTMSWHGVVQEITAPSERVANEFINCYLSLLQSSRETTLGRKSLEIFFRVFYSKDPNLQAIYRRRALLHLKRSRREGTEKLPMRRRTKKQTPSPSTSDTQSTTYEENIPTGDFPLLYFTPSYEFSPPQQMEDGASVFPNMCVILCVVLASKWLSANEGLTFRHQKRWFELLFKKDRLTESDAMRIHKWVLQSTSPFPNINVSKPVSYNELKDFLDLHNSSLAVLRPSQNFQCVFRYPSDVDLKRKPIFLLEHCGKEGQLHCTFVHNYAAFPSEKETLCIYCLKIVKKHAKVKHSCLDKRLLCRLCLSIRQSTGAYSNILLPPVCRTVDDKSLTNLDKKKDGDNSFHCSHCLKVFSDTVTSACHARHVIYCQAGIIKLCRRCDVFYYGKTHSGCTPRVCRTCYKPVLSNDKFVTDGISIQESTEDCLLGKHVCSFMKSSKCPYLTNIAIVKFIRKGDEITKILLLKEVNFHGQFEEVSVSTRNGIIRKSCQYVEEYLPSSMKRELQTKPNCHKGPRKGKATKFVQVAINQIHAKPNKTALETLICWFIAEELGNYVWLVPEYDDLVSHW